MNSQELRSILIAYTLLPHLYFIINLLQMKLLKTALLAILFGSLYTIFRKYQSVVDIGSKGQQFNQPIFQSFIIFIGMSSIVFLRPWIGPKQQESGKDQLPSDNMALYIMPSLLDVLGTIIDTAGLYYTSVSISQMLKGSVIFFTYIITLFYLKRSLPIKKHIWMLAILGSLTLIGFSNLSTASTNKLQSNPLLGNILIILSQFMFSLMFIYEQQILKRYKVRVENAVFWQGIWGVILSGIVLLIFSNIQSPIQSKVFQSCILICNNGQLMVAVILTAICIGPFNYFGISLTKEGSALQRCIICTSRMIVVWTLSLLFGWQQFRLLQLVGYSILTLSIYQFNKTEAQPVQNAQLHYDEQVRLKSVIQRQEDDVCIFN